MIPVVQTLTVAKDGTGNCFAACLASILEKTIDELPVILPNEPGVFHKRWERWLEEQGYTLEYCKRDNPPPGYGIVSILTDRVYPTGHKKEGESIYHGCVALDGKIVHDPFPEGSVVKEINYYFALEKLDSGEKE